MTTKPRAAAMIVSRQWPPQLARSCSTAPNSIVDIDQHHDHTEALGETPNPIEGDADDAARPFHRGSHHLNPPHRSTPPWWSTMTGQARCTAAKEAIDAPAQRACTPSKELPPPHTATHRRGEVAVARHRCSSVGALLDPSFNNKDPTAPATDPSPEPMRTPPMVGSPPSFHGEPGGGGSLGEGGNGSLLPSSCPRMPAARRLGDGVQERR
jgi:hypothetical protein